jgi:hypothetical protein
MAGWPASSPGRAVTANPPPAAPPVGHLLRALDPSLVTPYHHDAAGQVAELRVGEEARYGPGHPRAIFAVHARTAMPAGPPGG